MKKIEIKDINAYPAPGHFEMKSMKLHGKEESGASKFWMGLSHFLPGGGAEYGGAPVERIYFVLEGEMVVKSAKEEIVLKKWDSIFIGADEERELINKTNFPASMLVVVSNPD